MHPTFPTAITFLALSIFLQLQIATAQIGYDAKTNHFLCLSPQARFCAAGSLQGSSIIVCTPNGKAEIKSCDFELSHILPLGYEGAAVCYESAPKAGDAICALNEAGYTPEALEIDIPATRLCAEDGLPPMGLSVREGSDDTYKLAPQSLLSTPGVELGVGLFATAAPSTFQYHADRQKESATVLSCSNSWSKTGTGTGTVDAADENLTLNIVLAIPTSTSEPRPTTGSIAWSSSSSSYSYSSALASSVVMSQPCTMSPASSLASTTRSSSTNSSSDTTIPPEETLTLYGTTLAGPLGGNGSVVSNGAEYLHLGVRVVMSGFAMLVSALIWVASF
ncbi:hypothetical protein BDV19DRAFT_384601 [Aspergillus venezuelensis]